MIQGCAGPSRVRAWRYSNAIGIPKPWRGLLPGVVVLVWHKAIRSRFECMMTAAEVSAPHVIAHLTRHK